MANIDDLDYDVLEDTRPATEEAIMAFRAKQVAHFKTVKTGCRCYLHRMAERMKGRVSL